MKRWSSRKTAVVLWLFLVAFCGRVFGQLLMVRGHAPWLPPMEEWYSGLLPYPVLLPVQVLIILVFAWTCVDVGRGSGFWASPRPFFAHGLLVSAYIYLAVMLARYALRMILVPEARWFGQTIPIFFHWVLASFLIVFGLFHRVRRAEMGRRQGSGVGV